MRKIRVLRVITWLPVGGIERKIVEVLPRLDRSRFDVSLVCLRERGPLADELEARGIPVECIPFRTRWDLSALRRLARSMKERQIDLVHSHMYRSNVPATVAARLAGVRHVWAQVHNVGTWETRRQLQMDRLLCRWREGMIAVSEQVRRDVMENLRLPKEKIQLIYNGVDLTKFDRAAESQRQARQELREQNQVGPDNLVFLMAARLVGQKRPHDFLELAGRILNRDPEVVPQGFTRKAHFWFVGDGAMLEEVKVAASQLGHADQIRFFGRQSDVQRYMAAADVFVMTSTKEGFSNALLEAMASGLAVIATDVGGNGEAIRNETDGLIIPPMQPDELNKAAKRLLEQPALLQDFATNARGRAEGFSLDTMIRRVEELYESSVSKSVSKS